MRHGLNLANPAGADNGLVRRCPRQATRTSVIMPVAM